MVGNDAYTQNIAKNSFTCISSGHLFEWEVPGPPLKVNFPDNH